ncbi:DUF2892 domain-containing protein [Chitinophagaceae bacterium LB-8]|uniref:DUF2892 domain-containing protein n=1 Tax=Paraflavisolibacter caeni TaxID=2982496 RepID=A0A9X2XT89_9BACT|nr:DUF2892 domain-containing protein [Paraflavisolibacter caeni]MCU7548370.1 DUF2892 domain-containing protein [Paraflavisolibacter caeni]
MKRNVGSADRSIRLLAAAIIIILYFSNIITGTIGNITLTLAIILMLTSFAGFCPFYALLGVNTCEVKKAR